jgi:hypothetical protein
MENRTGRGVSIVIEPKTALTCRSVPPRAQLGSAVPKELLTEVPEIIRRRSLGLALGAKRILSLVDPLLNLTKSHLSGWGLRYF